MKPKLEVENVELQVRRDPEINVPGSLESSEEATVLKSRKAPRKDVHVTSAGNFAGTGPLNCIQHWALILVRRASKTPELRNLLHFVAYMCVLRVLVHVYLENILQPYQALLYPFSGVAPFGVLEALDTPRT